MALFRRGGLRTSQLHQSRALVSAYKLFRRLLEKLGLQVVVKTFYSPIPVLSSLPESVWERKSELAGIEFDLERQLHFLETELAPYLAEFAAPEKPTGRANEFFLENGSYGPVDADLLHAVVRHARPSRIVELGSGYTTLVIAAACRLNEREGARVDYRVFDPFPSVASPGLPGLTELSTKRAEDLPPELFRELRGGDLLVVDTTHTVKLHGDVNHIVLDILPTVGEGTIVHFHDVFLPWEYPRVWAEDYGLFWSEQYLLQAFLALNAEFEVVCAANALVREYPDRLASVVRSWRPGATPGAFWIRRRSASAR
jgi:hypothetical protein